MTDPNPITPPPELVQQWIEKYGNSEDPHWQRYEQDIATQAARWGADQELEACCVLMDDWGLDAADLLAARRPKPSLKEQALALVDNLRICDHLSPRHQDIIRRALEALPDDPAVTPPSDDRGPGSVAEQASPVATDDDLVAAYLSGERASLRPVYNLGREHGAASVQSQPLPVTTLQPGDRLVVDDDGQPTGVLRSDPAPTADGDRPLHEQIDDTYKSIYLYTKGTCLNDAYAEIMRVVADWLERKWSNKSMLSYGDAVDLLRAEADRAEAGE